MQSLTLYSKAVLNKCEIKQKIENGDLTFTRTHLFTLPLIVYTVKQQLNAVMIKIYMVTEHIIRFTLAYAIF